MEPTISDLLRATAEHAIDYLAALPQADVDVSAEAIVRCYRAARRAASG